MHRWLTVLVLVCVGGCMMLPAVETVGFVDGTRFATTKAYRYRVGATRHEIVVPEGFVTDYASIPAGPFRALFERQGRYSRAALVHDYLYWSQSCSRAQADNLFMIAMTELGVRERERGPIYQAVRLGGESAWNENTREYRSGLPRIVARQYRGLADAHTWVATREALRMRGERDPAFPRNLAYCALGNSTRVP